MKAFKVLTIITIGTFISLFYVHQQIELVKLSYSIEVKEKVLKDVLDRNDGLGYNINNLESPSYLEKTLSAKNIEVVFPKTGHVVRLAKVKYSTNNRRTNRAKIAPRPDNTILKMLSPSAEVRAY